MPRPRVLPRARAADGTDGPYITYLPRAVKAGLLPEAAVDAALRHTLGLRFELGLFDPIEDQPYWHVPPSAVASEAHLASALDATRQSLVLLTNPTRTAAPAPAPASVAEPHDVAAADSTTANSAASAAAAAGPHGVAAARVLPFRAGGTTIAVVGPHCNDKTHILGNYLGQICNDSYTSRACVPSVYEAVQSHLSRPGAPPSTVRNASGLRGVTSTDPAGITAALDAAQAADYVIYVGGLGEWGGLGHTHARRVATAAPTPGLAPLDRPLTMCWNRAFGLRRHGDGGAREPRSPRHRFARAAAVLPCEARRAGQADGSRPLSWRHRHACASREA